MSVIRFSESFLALMPLPLIVVNALEDDLNHPIVYVNNSFTETFGWTRSEIPDKNTWWLKAYPDPTYQKFVIRQWELAVETSSQAQLPMVMMEVNIQTKSDNVKRFKVYSELKSSIIKDHYVVIFEPKSGL